MNIIEKYYMRKATSRQSDEFHTSIDQNDIALIKKAQLYMVVAPVVTIGGVYLMNLLRSEVMMSKNFIYMIRNYQERFKEKYKRENDEQDQRKRESTE
jgi:uncharacterized membrane protein